MSRKFLLGLVAATVAAGAPAQVASSPRGDEPIAVPRSIKQGIDFVYVDPQMSSVARRKQKPQNWLSRLFNPSAVRRNQPNPIFLELARGLEQYQASWGRLPQVRIAPGAVLKRGAKGARVAALRERLGLSRSGGYDDLLAQRVTAYQQVHGLGKPDGIAGRATIASLNAGPGYYARRIAINMERAWRLPTTGTFDRYVVVDSGSAQAYLFQRDRIVDGMKVVVGAPATKTPMMAVLMRDAIANPYWHVPPELVKSLTAQKVKEQGLTYFRDFHYEVLPDWNEGARPIDPKSVNWAAIRTGRQAPSVLVRQKPGPWNSMGAMKFEMPNDFGIYLHDTPHKEKFDLVDRWISNGCVRLQDYRRFATWVLPGGVPATDTPEQRIELPKPVPIYMTYLTVAPSQDGVLFRADPYGFDAQAMPQMFGGATQIASAG